MKKNKEQMERFARLYAERQGFQLNPCKEIYEMIIDGLVANKEKYGRQYCPCRPVTGDLEVDKDSICPCVWHKDELANDGMCFCQLFLK